MAPLAVAFLACPAAAEPVTLDGVTFSDELGGVVLRGGHGVGTPSDPFVLYEDITDDGPAVLVVRGLASRLGAMPHGPAQVGFALRKVVTNRTARAWYGFELELREALERPSTYEDGLSFGQATAASRQFASDRFRNVHLEDEPSDAVVFSDGAVPPGETVVVSFAVTDYTPVDRFYLLQRREAPSAALEPAPHGG